MLTKERVRELFDYREDGILIWKQGQRAGKEANCVDKKQGYRRVRIDGKLYKNSRVIYLYHEGSLPKIVDHKNRDGLDDRIHNLRVASNKQNSWNASKRSDNSSGFRGVSFCKQKNKWRARLTVDGKEKHLGFFDNPTDASIARVAGETIYYGEFAST